MSEKNKPAAASATPISNFIRNIIDGDVASGKFATRGWGGKPGPAKTHANTPPDPAKIRTRFPPEPNGYLHIGHAKSICLNFGLAQAYDGACHMRFDDTNPEKEEQEYVDSIIHAVQWLGFDWRENIYFASDYFDFMYEAAQHLIKAGHAYVDEQSAEQMRNNRGTLTEPGTASPWRERPAEESLQRFSEMREGKHDEGTMVLRAKIDMASPNINLRDPAVYRIRKAEHHRTRDKWSVYPMYTYAHPIEDALERKEIIPDNYNLFGWLGYEWRDQLPKLPHEIARSLGYKVIPAIRVMCAEPNASQDLKSYQKTAEGTLIGAISYLDAQKKVLSTPTIQAAATLKRVGILRWSMQQILMTIDDTAAIAKIALPEN